MRTVPAYNNSMTAITTFIRCMSICKLDSK
jgi:hypothetical protein